MAAYCKRCGAYIPDGQSKCLACGYDEAEEQKNIQQAAAAYAYQNESERQREEQQKQQNDFARAEAEKRRAQRQEYDRAWAENEQRRRKMEQEFRQRQKAAEARAESYVNRSTETRQAATEDTIKKAAGKGMALLSYLGPLFILPMVLGDDEFTKFHARQGLKLFIASAVLELIGSIFSVGWAVWIFSVVLTVIGIRNVLNGKQEPLPYIGNKF